MAEIRQPASGGEPKADARGRRLRVIKRDALSDVLDIAVSRALRREMPSYDEPRVAAVQALVRQEFAKLVRDNTTAVRGIAKSEFLRELERSRDQILGARDRARAELAELEGRAGVLRELHDADLEHDRMEGVERSVRLDAELARRFREILARAEANPVSPRLLSDELVAAASALSREEWERSAAERARRAEDELGVFERRIKKLTASLSATEIALAKLSKLNEGDAGVASIYRTVQGLEKDADKASLKQLLLDRIFEANLALKKETG